jgi:hypothetical protein
MLQRSVGLCRGTLSTLLELEDAGLKMNEDRDFDIEQATKMMTLQRKVREGVKEECSNQRSQTDQPTVQGGSVPYVRYQHRAL